MTHVRPRVVFIHCASIELGDICSDLDIVDVVVESSTAGIVNMDKKARKAFTDQIRGAAEIRILDHLGCYCFPKLEHMTELQCHREFATGCLDLLFELVPGLDNASVEIQKGHGHKEFIRLARGQESYDLDVYYPPPSV